MATQYLRHTAIPSTLRELADGAWAQGSGMEPSGVKTVRGFIARANVIGAVIDKDAGGFTLEDGTATMSVRTFDQVPAATPFDAGTIVMVIGRPREYNGERYLVLELCKRVTNPAWVAYRRKELAFFLSQTPSSATVQPIIVDREVVVEVPADGGKNPYEAVVELVRELDAGQGADVDAVLERYGDKEGEGIIRSLLEDGEIFELRPGRVKVLE